MRNLIGCQAFNKQYKMNIIGNAVSDHSSMISVATFLRQLRGIKCGMPGYEGCCSFTTLHSYVNLLFEESVDRISPFVAVRWVQISSISSVVIG